MAQWAGAQVAATMVWLTSNSQLEGTIGRVADMAHTGSFLTRHSHFQPSVDSHRAINANDVHLLLWSNMENLKPTPRVVLRLGGYNDMTQIVPVSAGSRTPGHWREGNPVPEATAILVKNLKAVRKFPA